MDIEEEICGRNLLHSIRQQRNKTAADKRKWRVLLGSDGAKKSVVNRIVNEHYVAPPKPDADDLEDLGLDLLQSSRMPCPPLPCGADDAWFERAEGKRLEAFAMLDAAAILRAAPAHRSAPNLHAFDEAYFGED